MVLIKRITTADPLYDAERELRNKILLRPLGVPDGAWEMHDQLAWHFVAVENHHVLGCALLVPFKNNSTKAQFLQMAVDNSLQGKGLGKRLISEVIKFAKTQKLLEITCHSRAYASAFYEKLGFEKYGEAFEEVGLPHHHMRKTISPDA